MENIKLGCRFIKKDISQNDFYNHKNGIILSKPGYYKLTENIDFKPMRDGVTAITIQSPNIVLDLSIYRLRQPYYGKNNYGILISRDVNNIKITGSVGLATIIDFSAANIRIFGRTNNIIIENIISTQTQPAQLTNKLIPATMQEITNLEMNGGIIVGEGDMYAVYMQNTDRNNKVKNIKLSNVQIFNAMIGCQMVFTDQIHIDNCQIMHNTYYGMLFGYVWLILDSQNKQVFPITTDVLVENSQFNENVGRVTGERLSNPNNTYNFEFLSAIASNGAKNVTIKNCNIKNNQFTYYIIAADHDGSENVTWENCDFSGNSGTDLNFSRCDGLNFSGSIPRTLGAALNPPINLPYQNATNIVVNNCKILGTNAAIASGLEIAYGRNITIKNLTVEGINAKNLSRGIIITGAGDNGENGFSKKCVLENCVTNGNLIGISIEKYSENVVINNCTSNSNNSDGFIIHAVRNIIIKKCNATNNLVKGISVDGASKISLLNNTVTENNSVGISIVNAIDNILVAKNISYGHEYNYVGVSADNIIESGYGSLPQNVGLKNVSIN